MKRLMRSRSGGLIYAPRWQNMEAAASDEIQSDGEPAAATTETVIELGLPVPVMGNSRLESLSDRQLGMCKAALEGDWAAAETLLEQDPSLANDEITEWGDRALHLAVAVNNTLFVQKLVEMMNPDDLELLDGRGYSACCYAAITGMVEIADLMTKKTPNLGTARNNYGKTPLHEAALHGNKDMSLYFLKSVKLEDLSNDEWFHLLVVTIHSEMYDVASKILEMNLIVATMTDNEGTALHVLAQHHISGNLDALGNSRLESLSDRQLGMCKAALEGDWAAAETLLEQDPSLANDEITEWGDRALHLAVAVNNTLFVQKLVEMMNPDDLELLDGRGYSACCYAAITGMVEIADLMTKKTPNLGTARNNYGKTPLHEAALHGNKDMSLYFLKSVKLEDLSNDEWFHLLVVTIHSEMYDVASKILEMNLIVATMTDNEGTALHVLAQHHISGNLDALELAKKMWAEIQQLSRARVADLMKNPPILVAAAKVGNVELITMLTQTCPSLMWDTDSNGYTMFHIAVICRQENVFKLIHQIGAIKDLIVMSQDENGNNILHLAAKLAPRERLETVYPSALQMRREIIWFMEVRKIVPRSCKEKRNQGGQTPRELFYKEHKKLLASSEIWMRNTADSCMLIATIMLSVVFAAAFTVPGGNNQDTGIPLLLERKWFTCFVIFEALAFLGSTHSMLMFWTIMTWSTRDFYEDNFLHDLLYILKWGLAGLLGSLVCTIAAFMSAYFLAFVEEKAALIESVIILVFVIFLYAIYSQFSAFFYSMTFVEYVFLFRKHDLFSRVENKIEQV